jgi:hypothetical protein
MKIEMNENEEAEFVGSIIDIFEDFLEEKGITINDIPNKEREEYADGDLEGLAIIFGSDYDRITNGIRSILGDKE